MQHIVAADGCGNSRIIFWGPKGKNTRAMRAARSCLGDVEDVDVGEEVGQKGMHMDSFAGAPLLDYCIFTKVVHVHPWGLDLRRGANLRV